MRARHIILTIAALAILAAPATVLAQQGPGPGPGDGTCDGTGPGAASGPGAGRGSGHGFHGRGHGWHGKDGIAGLGFFERMLPRLADRLGLSEEQLTEIQGIADTARAKIEEEGYLEELRAERSAYRTANEDPRTFDEGAFLAHVAAMHEIETALGVVVGQAKADVFSVLTDEQIEQLGELRGSFEGRFRRGGDRRPGS
jgi:Spy/CpxP family protein refolding chaperone